MHLLKTKYEIKLSPQCTQNDNIARVLEHLFWPNVFTFEVLFVCMQDWFAAFSLQYTNIQHRLKLNSRPALALPQAAIAEILMYWMQSNFQLASAAPEVEPWRLNNCCFLYSFVTIYESRKEQKNKIIFFFSLHSLGQIGDMRVPLTGAKFRFKNIPAAKKKSKEEKELSQCCFWFSTASSYVVGTEVTILLRCILEGGRRQLQSKGWSLENHPLAFFPN